MLDKLKEICKEFHFNKLSYCILRLPKSKELFKEFEADILIKDIQLKNFHNILTANNFQHSQDKKLSHHHYRREQLHLDLVVSLCYGKNKEHFVSLGYGVLKRAIYKDDMYFASEIDEFLMLLLHCLFDKRKFDKHSTRIFQLINIAGEEDCIKEMSTILRG